MSESDTMEAELAVARLGARRERLRRDLKTTTANLADTARAAYNAGVPKAEIARLAHVSRVTLDAWLQQQEKS
jgi:hypothetical protein